MTRGPRTLPLAIFYGWPSLVNGSGGNVERAAAQFAPFDAAVLGDAIPTADSDPRARAIAERVSGTCRLHGYLSLGRGAGQPALSARGVRARLRLWARWGVEGVLLDCAGRDFGVSPARLADAVADAHDCSLHVAVNAWEPFDVLGSRAELGAGDALLAENDVLRHGAVRPPSAYKARLARIELARRELGVAVWAVGTSGPVAPASYGGSLTTAVVEAWQAAGAERPALLCIADPLYGASDNRMPIPEAGIEVRSWRWPRSAERLLASRDH